MILGTKGNYTQIKYPVSGGYKYAFALSSDVENNLKSKQQSTVSQNPQIQQPSAPNGNVQQNIYNLRLLQWEQRDAFIRNGMEQVILHHIALSMPIILQERQWQMQDIQIVK